MAFKTKADIAVEIINELTQCTHAALNSMIDDVINGKMDKLSRLELLQEFRRRWLFNERSL